MKLLKSILTYILMEVSVLLLIPTAYIIYPFIYPFKDSFLRNIFWIYFNDSEDGDYGDPRWQKEQPKATTKWQWFVQSYRWNVRRNPVWNYVGKVLNTTGTFNSPKTIYTTNGHITARYMTDYHKGHFGSGLFTFKVGNKDRFSFANMFNIGKYTVLFNIGFNEFRPVFKFSARKSKNLKKGF